MKKQLITTILTISFLISSVIYAETKYWQFDSSDSADSFIESMTNSTNGILKENFPLKSWTIKISDKEKFNSLISNRYYLRNFISKRVKNICTENGNAQDKCNSARKYLRKSWVIENDEGHTASYELALVFYKVDMDNWFSHQAVFMKIAQYLEGNYGTRLLRLYKGFEHNGVLLSGGIGIKDLPVVIDTKEQTITIFSATLYD